MLEGGIKFEMRLIKRNVSRLIKLELEYSKMKSILANKI